VSKAGKGPQARSKVLKALGILKHSDWKISKIEGARHQRQTRESRIQAQETGSADGRYSKRVVLALTEERASIGYWRVSDIGDEEERLLTILYYNLQAENLRGGKSSEDSE